MPEHTLGHAEDSRAAIDELIQNNGQQSADYQIAEAYAWRDEKDKAFEWLEHAYTARDGGVVVVKVDPLLASLRSEPRYEAFLHKIKLPA